MRSKIDYILKNLSIFFLAILVIDVLWQVISRYILTNPSNFTDELAGFLLIWVGLLGSAYVSGKNEHLAIDLLVQKVSKKKQLVLQVIIFLLVGVFALTVLVIGGTWLVYTRFVLDVKSAALNIPLGYVYIILPLSGLIIFYYSIDNSLNLFKSPK
ncbi:MAG: TRAP transporter small permease [Bacteroidales bacterium]|nr:TRAP transporter small permease [Bacteroidales bacterium]